jgi:4-alpha-glucanotransferase
METPPWLETRSAGVLAHISSLPGAFGIGNLGVGARAFVDFLARAGFQHWQICPFGPTGYGDSPYQSFSSFAGNPYFIDLEELRLAGLLTAAELDPLRALPAATVDYGELYVRFWPVLARAYERFRDRGDAAPWGGPRALAEFVAAEGDWLEGYATFMALKHHFGGQPWTEWPAEWRDWRPDLAAHLPAPAAREADRHRFYQFVFFRQWAALRSFATARGLAVVGDVPIFVALDSADTWRWRDVFRLDRQGRPEAVAGVPPDYFSASGQLWGNPLYDWKRLAETGYAWWIDRLRAVFGRCDIVRLDHFRGLDTYWEIPVGAPNARRGRWRRGPGRAFFAAVKAALPAARLIAEDLGYITAEVAVLRRAVGLPGMKVLQFAYGHDDNNVNLPHFFPAEAVVYTGTHDNDTTRGWLAGLEPERFAQVADYFGLTGTETAWPIIRAAFASVARLAMVPMQDLLDLPSTARMNHPGRTEGNWRWRFTADELAQLEHRRRETLRHWLTLFDRTGDRRQRDYSAPPAALPSGHSSAFSSATAIPIPSNS